MNVRAVFCDIGNVLLRYEPQKVVLDIAWALRRHPVRVARFIWRSRLVERIERGEIPPRRLYALFHSEFEFAGSYSAFTRLWCGHFSLLKQNEALMRRVARRVPVYLLSNTNQIHYDHIRRRYAFPRWADGAVLSYRVGRRKPEAGIYRAALRRAKVSAREAVFIDDLPENLAPARRMGMTVVECTGTAALRRSLAALGLLG